MGMRIADDFGATSDDPMVDRQAFNEWCERYGVNLTDDDAPLRVATKEVAA